LGLEIFFSVILVLQQIYRQIYWEAGGHDGGKPWFFLQGRGASAFCVLGKLAVFAVNL
jgi:hypothetical protein